MAHNKLYRNFIILQEDENCHSGSQEKPLSGYAKIEARSDKCKISFYAQNLKKDEKYTMVLICYRKELKQIVDLGFLEVNEVGKGEAVKEYYINDIAGLNFSYEKISGAAICKHKNEELSFLMYGFMNNENINEDWKKSKVVKCTDKSKIQYYEEKSAKEKELKEKEEERKKEKHKKEEYKEEKCCDEKEKHKEEKYCDKKEKIEAEDKHKKDYKEEHKKEEKCCGEKEKHKEDKSYDEKEKHKEEKCCGEKEKHKEEKSCDEKEKVKIEDKYKKEYKQEKDKEDKYCKEEKQAEYPKKKKEEYHKHNEDYECVVNCKRGDSKDEDDYISQKNFDEYEEIVKKTMEDSEIDPYDFSLRGAMGDFFNNIVKGFEEVKDKFKEIKYCKWYKIKINSIDDMCNTADYNKYTVAYYPMLNYYPYIKKYGYFFIGYKCNSKGDLKYIVYGIPGKKDKDEQPYVGKTGFVTWISSDDGKVGCWLMFYDYKNSNIVVPMK